MINKDWYIITYVFTMDSHFDKIRFLQLPDKKRLFSSDFLVVQKCISYRFIKPYF